MTNNDLISRSALKAELMKRAVSCPKSHIRAYGSCISALEVSPAVDAEPVRHGEWILNPCNLYNDATWVCSVCGNEWGLIDGTPLDNQMNYCPKCGARMDGGIDGDNKQ